MGSPEVEAVVEVAAVGKSPSISSVNCYNKPMCLFFTSVSWVMRLELKNPTNTSIIPFNLFLFVNFRAA